MNNESKTLTLHVESFVTGPRYVWRNSNGGRVSPFWNTAAQAQRNKPGK